MTRLDVIKERLGLKQPDFPYAMDIWFCNFDCGSPEGWNLNRGLQTIEDIIKAQGYNTESTATWRSTSDGTNANFGWQEYSVERTGLPIGGNKVTSLKKGAGETWTLEMNITYF